MNIKQLAAMGLFAVAFGAQTATAQFFTNDLTDAASVAVDFTENIATTSNSVWSYTNDFALAQDGTTNSFLEGGAVINFVSVDDDSARSYLATVNSNYLDKSWKARIAVETVNVNPKNYIFFGLGAGVPNTSDHHEPTSGQGIHVVWQTGNSRSNRV